MNTAACTKTTHSHGKVLVISCVRAMVLNGTDRVGGRCSIGQRLLCSNHQGFERDSQRTVNVAHGDGFDLPLISTQSLAGFE